MRIGNNATLASAMALGIATLSTATLSNANGLALAASDDALSLVDHHLLLADNDLTLDAATGRWTPLYGHVCERTRNRAAVCADARRARGVCVCV